ncbi:type II secretion system protein GspG, partial [bacterium]|nr:type II secretion system protein GspG [bacterium]
HPENLVVGVCMNCGRLICSECRTRLDGRNVCPECSAELEARAQRWKSVGRIAVLVLVGLMVGYWLTRPGELPPTVERLEEVREAVERFKSDLGRWPGGLEDLLVRPTGESDWTGPYLGDERFIGEGYPTDVHGLPLEYGVDPRGVWLATAGDDGLWQTDLAVIGTEDEPGGDDLVLWVHIEKGAQD